MGTARRLWPFPSSGRPVVPSSTILVATLVLSGCSWFTDFKEQPKIDPWESPSDTIPFRGNPQNSIPMYGSMAPGIQYDRSPTPAALAAMAGIANPVAADSASVSRGRIQYQINCAVCHGPSGMGDGPVAKIGMQSGLVPPPIGAGSNAANTLTDGYLFGIIRNGRGTMPPYNRIEEPDRWDIVNYLRSLQGKGTIAADTSHGRPGETGALVPGASRMGPTRPAPFYRQNALGASPIAAPADTTRATAAPSDTTSRVAPSANAPRPSTPKKP
jgi:mono/diheme cytochrome c family protein